MADNTSIIDLYLQAQGESEVPIELHKWAIISLIAACVRDRVWFRKFGDSKLYPNLYVMLIGPSAVGKGIAINKINRIAARKEFRMIGAHRLKASAAGIADILCLEDRNGKPKKPPLPGEPPIGKVFLITPELSDSISIGPMASSFVKFMTDLYEASDLDMEDISRQWGQKRMVKPVINWLAGTTKEWLMSSLNIEDLMSGFTARSICLLVYYTGKRYTRPIPPHNRDELLKQVSDHLCNLLTIQGQYRMTRQARELEDHWYMNRADPDGDDTKRAIWHREHDMSLKLSTIWAMSKPRTYEKMLITSDDFDRGRNEIETVNSKIDELINYVVTTGPNKTLDRAQNIIINAGAEGISRPTLLKELKIKIKEFEEIVDTLKETQAIKERSAGDIEIYHTPAGLEQFYQAKR